ncbi:hypothetical protein [Gordonia sp. ABSL49_1]|uniref:hypothetical protein n=1 Tax=Gordonia sp. ABSL49_1 TaxID=2920941 RepID=UPI001F104B47|nr:hypothetical protein [Gordonia sp. ABSL49_1]MCH5645165.1 hypothetical protein [Gordonia sp. ABSL49_1]
MPVPEGYAVAPTSTDHLVKIAVPIPGRDPILIEAPKLSWLTPDEVEKYQEWLQPILDAEKEVTDWHIANDDLPEEVTPEMVSAWHEANDDLPEDQRAPLPRERAPFPDEAKAKADAVQVREVTLRWIKPYVSAAEYKTLVTSKKIPERTIEWIKEQLTSPDITVGESEASTSS